MPKTSKKAKSPVKSAKRKVAIKDLKAKSAGSVKGGAASLKFGEYKVEATDQDHKDWIIIESMSSPIRR